MNPRRSILPAVLILGAGAVLNGAQAQASTPPTVTSAVLTNSPGGGLTALITRNCDVVVDFSDDSPSAPKAYEALVMGVSSGDVVGRYVGARKVAPGEFRVGVPCNDLADGTAYEVAVSEDGAEPGTSADFTYKVIRHPAGSSASAVERKGVNGWAPGKPVKVWFKDGAWEKGTVFSTQLWVSKTPQFTDADFTANTRGTAAVIGAYETDAPVLRFTLPTTTEGMYAWLSIVGEVPSKNTFRHSFSAVPVHGLPAQPRAWVRSFGKQSGSPQVGRSVSVEPPALSPEGKRNLDVEYQWFVNGGRWAIPGATQRTFTPDDAQQGQKLSLRVTAVAKEHAPREQRYTFGTVK